MDSLADSSGSCSSGFQKIADSFLSQPGLPFASVLSAERIGRIFAKHENLFGGAAIYSTAIMVWSFLSQVLRDGKDASCQSAVARVVTHRQDLGQSAPTKDTGVYCRARAKLSEPALRALAVEVAAELETQVDPQWSWKGLHPRLVDGFTFTMPDTPQNQREFPQNTAQKPGVGLPIARAVAVLSLTTACVTDAAIGPYAGKETGETALLRQLLDRFGPSDLAVMDRCYCSFMMIALMCNKGAHVCARMHQRRHVDFRRGRRLGKNDHLITWTKPEQRPQWMDQASYDAAPQTLVLREIRYSIVEKGKRTKTLTVATTLTDPELHSSEDIAQLYGFRWNAELDIRSIKQSLNLSHVRCKSPEMVRSELWATLLAYNLIRTTAAAAALLHDKEPRQISFTGACQYILSSWMTFAGNHLTVEELERRCRELLAHIAECKVAHRPGRLEPRVLKRRRHGYKLMQESRRVLKERLETGNAL